MAQVRDIHGGRDYDPEWGKRMKGEGAFAELIGRRFRAAIKRASASTPPSPACAPTSSACPAPAPSSCRCSDRARQSASPSGSA